MINIFNLYREYKQGLRVGGPSMGKHMEKIILCWIFHFTIIAIFIALSRKYDIYEYEY